MEKIKKEFIEVVIKKFAGKTVSNKEVRKFIFDLEAEQKLKHKRDRIRQIILCMDEKIKTHGHTKGAVYEFSSIDDCMKTLLKAFSEERKRSPKKKEVKEILPSDERVSQVYTFLQSIKHSKNNHIKFTEASEWLGETVNSESLTRINLLLENFFKSGKNLLKVENFYHTKGTDKSLYDSFSFNLDKLNSTLFSIHEYRKKKEASSEPSFRYLISEMKEDELKEILGSERVQFKGIYGKDGNNNLYQVNLSDTSGLEKVKGTFYFMKKDTELMSVVEERRHLVANYVTQMEKMKKEFEENLQKLQKSL